MKFKNLTRITSILIILILTVQNSLIAQPESEVEHPEWSKNSVIYEVNIRQYTPEGTFSAFSEHLPRLKKMGIEILWLMPIHPIGEKNRKGTSGSYYAVKDYKAVNPEYGTEEDFRELVEAAHELDLKLIIDWVANHTAWDNVWTETHPEFFTRDSTGNFIPPVPDWSDVIDLNYDNKELWTYMIDALKYWIEEFDIDGYRCDVAMEVPTEFWNQARAELDEIKPVFMLAEAEQVDLHLHAFDMTYAWHLHHIMNEIAKGKMNVIDLTNYYMKEDTTYPANAYRMVFTSNHDENSWKGDVFERMGDAAETFLVFSGVVEGMPLIYSGQEAGLDRRLEFFEKDTIEWKDHKFEDLYTKLNNLKIDNVALWNGEFGGEMQILTNDQQESLFAFVREKGDQKVFAIFNLTADKIDATITGEEMAGTYTNLFTNEPLTITNSLELKLKPWEYFVYVK